MVSGLLKRKNRQMSKFVYVCVFVYNIVEGIFVYNDKL